MSSLPPPPPPPEPLPFTPPPPPEPLPMIPPPPAGPPAPPEPAYSQPVYPQQPSPIAQQPPIPPAVAPRSSSTRAGVLIAVGITLTLVVLAGALFALFSTLSNSLGSEASGDDDTPTVVEEDPACADCLTFDDALELRMPDGAPTLGLTFDDAAGYLKPSVVGTYADSSQQAYEDGGGFPLGCSFAIDYSPVSPTSPGENNRTDRVGDLGGYINDSDYLSLVVRVFESEADAAAYPDSLRDGIAACPHYEFSFSEGDDYWSTDVEPLEFATSSPAVTAIGWHEHYGDSDLIIADLQYANLAVRTVYNRTGDPGTDEAFRAFVLELSGAMEALGN